MTRTYWETNCRICWSPIHWENGAWTSIYDSVVCLGSLTKYHDPAEVPQEYIFEVLLWDIPYFSQEATEHGE